MILQKEGGKWFDGDAVISNGCFPNLLYQTGCRSQIHFHAPALLGVTQDQWTNVCYHPYSACPKPPIPSPSHLQLTCGEFLGNLVSHGCSPLWIDYGQQIGLKCPHSFDGFLVNNGGTATASHFKYFWFQFFLKDMSNCRHVEGIQGNLEKWQSKWRIVRASTVRPTSCKRKMETSFFGVWGNNISINSFKLLLYLH